MKPGDIVRVKSRDLIFSGGGTVPPVEVERDEILLVLSIGANSSVNVLHPRHGAGWVAQALLEVISEAG